MQPAEIIKATDEKIARLEQVRAFLSGAATGLIEGDQPEESRAAPHTEAAQDQCRRHGPHFGRSKARIGESQEVRNAGERAAAAPAAKASAAPKNQTHKQSLFQQDDQQKGSLPPCLW